MARRSFFLRFPRGESQLRFGEIATGSRFLENARDLRKTGIHFSPRALATPLATAAAGAAHAARRRRIGIAFRFRGDRFAGALVPHPSEEKDLRAFRTRRAVPTFRAPRGPKKQKLAHSQIPAARVAVSRNAPSQPLRKAKVNTWSTRTP
jgi:hypothetical protein